MIYYGVKYSIQGVHKEGKQYTNELAVMRVILKAILAKAKQIDSTAYISPWVDSLPPLVRTDDDLALIRPDMVYEYLFTPRML